MRPAVDRRPGDNGSGHRGDGGPGSPGYRLPAPVRERRPALAALAILLIVGGALASGLIVMRSGQRSDYLVIRGTIDPGSQIRSSDLGVASIAGQGASAIPAARRSTLVGLYATSRLYNGTLATYQMFTRNQRIPAGAQVVGVSLSSQQRPAVPPRRGDVVAVYLVPRADAGEAAARVLVTATQVVDVGDDSNTGTSQTISVLVPTASAPTVTEYAALGRIAIAELPPGTPLNFSGSTAGTAPGTTQRPSTGQGTTGGTGTTGQGT